MLHSMRKRVFAAVVIVLLLVGLTAPLDALARSTQPATVRASLAAGTASVTNNVTIRPDSISLGSVFDANGQVSAGGKPLANASVALHMGDVILGSTKTDQLGHYAISVPVGASYFPAALNGATVYTVVEPVNSSFISAPSVATDVAVDQAPLYAIIVVIIAAAVAVVLYLFVRRFRGKAAPATPIAPIVHPLDPEQTLSDIRQNKTAMPSKHATPVAASETAADGKVVIDVTNALGPGMKLAVGFSTSSAEKIQKALPDARVVKAFNTVFAQNQSTAKVGAEQLSAFIAGDDDAAKRVAMQLAADIGFDPIDVGTLRSARYLEPMGMLLISLGYDLKMGTNIGFKLIKGTRS